MATRRETSSPQEAGSERKGCLRGEPPKETYKIGIGGKPSAPVECKKCSANNDVVVNHDQRTEYEEGGIKIYGSCNSGCPSFKRPFAVLLAIPTFTP